MPTYARADLSKVLPAVRCTARRQDGQACRAMAARGANVCRVHGGSAPQVKAAAKRRLEQAADVLVERLLGFALDGKVADPVALAAIRDALDRAGLKPGVEVGVTVKPYQTILEGIESGSRAEFRASIGREASESRHTRALVDTHELPTADDTMIEDAELVNADDDTGPFTTDDERGSPFDSAAGVNPFRGPGGETWADEHCPFGSSGPPPDQGMMSLEDAVAAQAQMRRAIAHRPAQRALPRGRQ